EVIALTAEEVMKVQQAGGDRIELVADMAADGLSPSEQTIETVLAVAKIPVRLMVRFHNNGVVLSKEDVAEMCQWIKRYKHYPVEGFVIGGITAQGKIVEYL